jgi:DNA-binding HxlR family transcriptional regulator
MSTKLATTSAAEQLQIRGFDTEYRLTEDGRNLESLIDKLDV